MKVMGSRSQQPKVSFSFPDDVKVTGLSVRSQRPKDSFISNKYVT